MIGKLLRRIRPADMIVIISVNVLVGCYLWIPYVLELNEAKKIQLNEQVQNETTKPTPTEAEKKTG
jgi:hypothetical protein